MSVKGKTILITGGASGIGAATAELFAREGATVVVVDIADAQGNALVDRLGANHRYIHLDVSKKVDWDRLLPGIIDDIGGLDIAFLNAGVMTRPYGRPLFNDPLPWITPQSMERLIGVNLYGPLWGTLACLPFVARRKGTILVTASASGLRPYPADPTYTMVKYGVVGLVSALGPTLEEMGVRIVTVCPNGIDTPMSPPDLHAKKTREGTFSPPSHMAKAVMHIYENAKAGEIWLGRANQSPYRHDPVPLTAPVPTQL